MKLRSFPLIVVLLTLSLAAAYAQRAALPLADGWKFIKQDAGLDASYTSWEAVTVPHTWNALDGQNGKKANPDQESGYYRGPAWYAKEFAIPADWKGKRVFIRFEAASQVADVYLNGQHLGQHRGGFAAFAFELTPHVKAGPNVLKVKVDNTKVDDVAPLSGDFTVFGGIYRPVQLLAIDPVGITALDYGASGVYLTQKKVSATEAEIEVETKVSNGSPAAAPVTIQVDLLDATGQVVQTATTANAATAPGATTSVKTPLTVKNPHLWNGRKDPYLYQARVSVLREGKAVDSVTQPLGIRSVQLTEDKGFLLNGEPYALHGVNRHQEVQDKGWALSEADHQADLQLILDIGSTSLRLAHYQQSDYFIDLCDKSGLVVWEEIPVVERVSALKEFDANAQQQLREMILQGYNHPSIAFWGIYNELLATWLKIDKHVDPVPLLKELRKEANLLDPSRPVVAASWTADPLSPHATPEWQCINTYPGWYWGKVDEFAKTIEKAAKNYGKAKIAISEYGSGANTKQHMEGELKGPKPDGPYHPEEWQTYTHEIQWAQAKNNPHVWGTFVWAMFDFASDGRDEGSAPGINDKGLVTHDRKIKKDAFYFYQANWSDKPMIRIAESRMTPRKLATTTVKVYSNCKEVGLTVNGKAFLAAAPDDNKIVRWKDVALQPGKNVVEVSATGADGQKVTDTCEWVLEAQP